MNGFTLGLLSRDRAKREAGGNGMPNRPVTDRTVHMFAVRGEGKKPALSRQALSTLVYSICLLRVKTDSLADASRRCAGTHNGISGAEASGFSAQGPHMFGRLPFFSRASFISLRLPSSAHFTISFLSFFYFVPNFSLWRRSPITEPTFSNAVTNKFTRSFDSRLPCVCVLLVEIKCKSAPLRRFMKDTPIDSPRGSGFDQLDAVSLTKAKSKDDPVFEEAAEVLDPGNATEIRTSVR